MCSVSSGNDVVIVTFEECSVNRERFTGLNFHGFHPMKFFTGKLSQCLMLNALKQYHHYTKLDKYSRKTFEKHKNRDSFAQ